MAGFDESALSGAVERPQFANPEHPGCPGCNSEVMTATPVRVTDGYVLAQIGNTSPDGTTTFPDAWFAFPREHAEGVDEVPDDWFAGLKDIVAHLRENGVEDDLTLSMNIGGDAGQTVDHLHTWVTVREPDVEAPLTSGLGLDTVILNSAKRAGKRETPPLVWPVLPKGYYASFEEVPDNRFVDVKREIAILRAMGFTGGLNISFDISQSPDPTRLPYSIRITERDPGAESTETASIGVTTIARRAIMAVVAGQQS